MVHQMASLEEFERILLESGDKLIVVDFTATWCPPCQRIAPLFENLAQKYPDVVFCKVDVDQCRDVAKAQRISAMPTFKFFKRGTLYHSFRGASVQQLEEGIQTYSQTDAEPNPLAADDEGGGCILL